MMPKQPTLALLAVSLFLSGPASAAGDEERGRSLFLRECAECHGTDGTGNGPESVFLVKPPANLRDGRILARYGDEEIVAYVRDGKRLRIELRPELVKQRAGETEALYRFIRRLPEVEWSQWADGDGVFAERCVACHDPYGGPSANVPEGVARPRDLSDPEFQKSITDEELAKRVRHGKKGMPALVPRLSEDEARDVIAYVRLLSPGYELYDRYCSDCHGLHGEGGTAHLADATAPDFAFDEDFFASRTPDQVRKAIWHMMREKTPSMPHFRDALSAEEVKAIVAYLRAESAPRSR